MHDPCRRRRVRSPLILIACAMEVAGLAGCSDKPPPVDPARYVPTPQQAEAALQAVFEAWKAGAPPGMVPETSPAVHLTDTFRKPDETLVDYRILGEVPTDKPRCYAVELRFNPERAERGRFVVVGIDPLWVFRQEDFELLNHWDHNMENPAINPPAAGETADRPTKAADDREVESSEEEVAPSPENSPESALPDGELPVAPSPAVPAPAGNVPSTNAPGAALP